MDQGNNINIHRLPGYIDNQIFERIRTTLRTLPREANGSYRRISGNNNYAGSDDAFMQKQRQPLNIAYGGMRNAQTIRPRYTALTVDQGRLKLSKYRIIERRNNVNEEIVGQVPYEEIVVSEQLQKLHCLAYIKFISRVNDSFSNAIAALTYISILDIQNIDQNNNIHNLSKLLTNIVEHNNNLYKSSKTKLYKFYDNYVTIRLKNITTELIETIISKLKQNNNLNIKNDNIVISLIDFFIKIDKFKNKNILKIIDKKNLDELSSELKNKIKISPLSQTFNLKNRLISSFPNLSTKEIYKYQSLITHSNDENSQINEFTTLYSKRLKDLYSPTANESSLKKLSNLLSNEGVKQLMKNEGYNYTRKLMEAIRQKKMQFSRSLAQDILKSQKNKKKLDSYKFFTQTILNDDIRSIFSRILESKQYGNHNSNLKNLKNQYIKNIEQNGVNSIPNVDKLKEEFKEKPAFLREILRKKRSKGSSSASKIYKDEINYFKKTGKYRPIKAYENNILIGVKNMREQKKMIKNKINNLTKKRITIEANLKNNNNSNTIRTKKQKAKNDFNKTIKQISELKNELKKIDDKIDKKQKEVKGGLMNKSKGINIDKEVDDIRKKYQKELLLLGKKHLEDLWKSYYSSLTKKNAKYENSKINSNYEKSKKDLQKNFGNGFINTYSPPVYKQLAIYKKYVEQRMRKLRADVAKIKSPRKIKIVRRVK